MGRRRKPENAQYPAGLYPSRGWLFWQNKVKVCRVSEWGTRAGRDRWAEISTGKATAGTVAAMLDGLMAHRQQLLREKKIAARTYEDNLEYCKPLKAVFGNMLPHQITMRHCAGYLKKRSWTPPPKKGPDGELIAQAPRRAPVRANKEMSLLSEGYAWAMGSDEWPLVTTNPCVGVERNPTKPSERCPEVWEIEAVKEKAPWLWKMILDLTYKIGQRGVQTRLLPKRDIRPEGIFVGKAKGGWDIFIEWDDELVAIVLGLLEYTAALERALGVTSPYLIVSRTGQPYTAHGWKTTVYKLVRAALADPANALEKPFSYHNIRARSATDEEKLYGTSPQHRLGHKRRSTTEDYLRDKSPRWVKPLPLRKAS